MILKCVPANSTIVSGDFFERRRIVGNGEAKEAKLRFSATHGKGKHIMLLPELFAFLRDEAYRLETYRGITAETSRGNKALTVESLIVLAVAGIAKQPQAWRDRFWDAEAMPEVRRLHRLEKPAHYDVYADSEPPVSGGTDGGAVGINRHLGGIHGQVIAGREDDSPPQDQAKRPAKAPAGRRKR